MNKLSRRKENIAKIHRPEQVDSKPTIEPLRCDDCRWQKKVYQVMPTNHWLICKPCILGGCDGRMFEVSE